MAHYRIFEVSAHLVNIADKKYWLDENDFASKNCTFVDSVADYIYNIDDADRMDSIKTLAEDLECGFTFDFGTDGTASFKMLPGGKQKYFAEKYEFVKKLFSGMDLNKFCDRHFIETIETEIAPRIATHYIWESGLYQSLEMFLRTMEEDKIYYFGGMVGFHV